MSFKDNLEKFLQGLTACDDGQIAESLLNELVFIPIRTQWL